MDITFPPVLHLDEIVLKNEIRQMAVPPLRVEGAVATFRNNRTRGHLFQPTGGADNVLVISSEREIPDGYPKVLQASLNPDNAAADLSRAVWLRHPAMRRDAFNPAIEIAAIRESWRGSFSYAQEDPERGIKGLRKPQIAAVHSVHTHWAVTDKTATIVMPTGTGKTEAMLAILVSTVCERVLVVVPTDALRSQLADKFLTLGILKDPEATVLGTDARRPIVCSLNHFPKTVAEVDTLFERAHVVVTTSSIAGRCAEDLQARMAHHCDALFIDEAHHAEAPTWVQFKRAFANRRILQFTATPFREDGQPLDGDIIFKYPLARAQAEGYFRAITFEPIHEFNPLRADLAVATKAIDRLRQEQHLGHVLMARTESVARAEEVYAIYQQHAGEFNPVRIHSKLKTKEREEIRQQILSGHSKVVVCVDMLGEGFDLPTLKIAAFHDIRKTLAVTLQLAGRFTRARRDLGNATFIANTADVNVRDELRKLYTRDPDWNVLLPQITDALIGEQLTLQEFLRGFTDFTDEIPLKTVQPATSAVVYRTRCQDWRPDNFRDGIHAINSCEQVHHTINERRHTLVVVTARRVPLAWSDVEHLYGWEWELYVVIWAQDQQLLYINCSSNAGEYRGLAKAIGGDDVSLINGQDVFKTFAGVNRLQLQNVGLTEQLGRNVRYTGRMGADVEGGVTEVQRRRAIKSVLSGSGFESGRKVTVGASRKGRIWSHRRERVDQLIEWCRGIGAKLINPALDPNEILRGTLESQIVTERPTVMAIGIDWPEVVYSSPESQWIFRLGNADYSLGDLEIELMAPTLAGPLRFAIAGEAARVEFELELFQDGENPNYRYVLRGDGGAQARHGTAARAHECAEWFYDNPPVIWFADGASLEGNLYVPLKHQQPPYDRTRIQTWDWAGVDIRRESQGLNRAADSIQARVIRELVPRGYTVLFDDDASGEAADVVGIHVVGGLDAPTAIEVDFFHCKFSSEDNAGARVGDLYELCGQAQKSTSWMYSHDRKTDLFTHLLRRESKRRDANAGTRFERGDNETLISIREISRVLPVSLRIFMVQPGLSRARASDDQLMLLSVTENYLRETYELPLEVIASA